MILTINRTVKTIEPIQVQIETPSYYSEYGKRVAILEDETIIEIFQFGTMTGLTFYKKDLNCLNYKSRLESLASMNQSTESEFAELLKRFIDRTQINELFNTQK